MNDGAPPRPTPKAVRPSLEDPLESAPPTPLAAPLPPPKVVQTEIQNRAKAMREKDTLPPPRRASGFPSAPPPPALRAHGPPALTPGPDALASRPSAPPPLGSARPPPPSRVPVALPAQPALPALPAQLAVPAQPALPARPSAPAPIPEESAAAARTSVTPLRMRVSQSPPALPSFGAALAQRVRFAGGEVPLWSLVTPLVLLVALGTAFAAAAATSAADPSSAQAALKANTEPSAHALPAPLPAPAPSVLNSAEDKPKPLTLLERVERGDDAAVKELSAKRVSDLSVAEAISLSVGQSAENVRAARALRDRIDHDPGLIKDPEVLGQLRRYSDDPETARDALSAMANVPGPISADLIYEVWTATASRTTATDLARSLLYSKEVRAKASPALAVALALRDADTCDQNRDLVGRASTDGDRRVFHLLGKLTRKYGCGPNKRADCYACLRSDTDLDGAMKAVKARREPNPFGGG